MTLLAAVTAEPSATAQTVRSVVGLAVCGLSAVRGYRKAEVVARETGSLPRGWSPTTWSGICFASLLVGHVWLASAAGKARVEPRPPEPQPVGPDPRFTWGGADDSTPTWALPAPQVPTQPTGDEERPVPVVAPAPLPVPMPAVVQAPPKPFSMNRSPLQPAEPLVAPAAPIAPEAVAAPVAAVIADPEPVPEVVTPETVAEAVAAPEPPAAPVVADLLPEPVPTVEVVPESEPADEPVVPVSVPRVASLDVLPAAVPGRRRR